MGYSLWLAFLGTGFSFLGTTAGSAMVYLFRDDMDARVHRVFLGFASGVMIAASFWSLLLPCPRYGRGRSLRSDSRRRRVRCRRDFPLPSGSIDAPPPRRGRLPGGQTLFPGPLHLAGSGGNPPQHPRRHGGGPLLRPGSRRGFHRHHGRVHRLGHWHGAAKFPRRGGYLPSLAPGGHAPGTRPFYMGLPPVQWSQSLGLSAWCWPLRWSTSCRLCSPLPPAP